MSITTLTRTVQVRTRPSARAPRAASAAPTASVAGKPRRPRRHHRVRHHGTAAVPEIRVIDLKIRSGALWPRGYR